MFIPFNWVSPKKNQFTFCKNWLFGSKDKKVINIFGLSGKCFVVCLCVIDMQNVAFIKFISNYVLFNLVSILIYTLWRKKEVLKNF